MYKRFSKVLLLVFILYVCFPSLIVYALPPCEKCHGTMDDGDYANGERTCKSCRGIEVVLPYQDSKGLLDKLSKEMGQSVDYSTFVSVYSALKTTGFSDYESTAILVNMIRESAIQPDAGQTGGGAIGLIQWDGGRRDALQEFSEKSGNIEYTVKGFKIGDIGTQVAFILEELENRNQWGGVAPFVKYSALNKDEVNTAVNDSSIDLSQKVSLEEWRSMTNVIAMSLYFTSQFERCAYEIDIYNLGAKQAPDMYKVITGCDPSTESNQEVNESIANAMVLSGIWEEKEFVDFCNLTETPLTFPDRDSLSDSQLKGVVDWRNNVKYKSEDGLIKYIRVFIMFFGIAFLVWMVLIYLSYWFDRINNFIDIEFLPMMTGNRLRIAPEENECTFNPKSFVKGTAQTVNHKAIVCICLVGIFFSVTVITGYLYTFLSFIIKWILSFIK